MRLLDFKNSLGSSRGEYDVLVALEDSVINSKYSTSWVKSKVLEIVGYKAN